MSEELIRTLRSFSEAYPEEVFTPLTDEDRKLHGILITRASAGMGRHCAKFMREAADALERTEKAAARYEAVRKLNVQQFADLYLRNIGTGTPFDQLVDELIES